MTPQLTRHEDIAVLTLGSDENRFSLDHLDAINARFDAPGNAAIQAISGLMWSK